MPVLTTALDAVLDRLADFESDSAPVLSLYLDLKPGAQASQTYESFLVDARKEHPDLEKDFVAVQTYLDTQKPSAHAIAVFSSSGEPAFFEVVPLDASVGGHR